jgi:hypothetical protein
MDVDAIRVRRRTTMRPLPAQQPGRSYRAGPEILRAGNKGQYRTTIESAIFLWSWILDQGIFLKR